MNDQIRGAIEQDLLRWLDDASTDDRLSSFYSERIVAATVKNLREDNQDRVLFAKFESPYAEREFMLFAVLDGMGGMLDGGHCANLAIASILANLAILPRTKNRFVLIEALTLANTDIFDRYQGRGGTTFAGVFIDRQGAKSVNVGDSRVYRFDCEAGLHQLSSDDRLGDQFAKVKGLEHVTLDPSIAERLGQHIGMCGPIRPNVRPIQNSIPRHSKGAILISTDGAHASGDEHISVTFQRARSLKDVAKEILKMAQQGASGDNATFICVDSDLLLQSNMNASVQRETLSVWSPQGLFTFVMQKEDSQHPAERRAPKTQHTKKGRKKITDDRPQEVASPDNATERKSTHEIKKASVPTVTIEQLTFEPLKADEPSK